jgi:ketosteroid isomerase-like protein
MQRHKHTILIALVMAVMAVGIASASEQADVMATVHRFVDGFNKGDTKTMLAACAPQAAVIDEFPPYAWHGVSACFAWAKDYAAYARKNGITEGMVTIDEPRHIEVTGDRVGDHAYVIVPANYSSKHNGKPEQETGAAIVLVLQKGAAGWRIVAWTWSQP